MSDQTSEHAPAFPTGRKIILRDDPLELVRGPGRACERRAGLSADRVWVEAALARLGGRQQLEEHDVDDRMLRGADGHLEAKLLEHAGELVRALGGTTLALEHERAGPRLDGGEVAVQQLLGLERLRRDARALAQLQHRLLARR